MHGKCLINLCFVLWSLIFGGYLYLFGALLQLVFEKIIPFSQCQQELTSVISHEVFSVVILSGCSALFEFG
jgi:hypothetical protein